MDNPMTVETAANTTDEGFESLPPQTQREIKQLRKENEKRRLELEQFRAEYGESIQSQNESEEPGLAEADNYRELHEKSKARESDLEARLKTAERELSAYKEIYEAERLELLSKLPPDEREEFKDLSKKQLQKILEKTVKLENSAGSGNKRTGEQDVLKISPEEWALMSAENPEQYKTLKTKHLKLLRGRI